MTPHLNQYDTIITANKRQILTLEHYYYQQLKDNGLPKFMPNIVDYQSFLVQSWQKIGIDSPITLLNKTQQFFIWAQIIRNPSHVIKKHLTHLEFLIKDNQLIKQVMSEYGLVCQFEINASEFERYFSTKSAVFLLWQQAYQAFLVKNKCIDEFDVVDLLIKKNQNLMLKGQVFYYGFKQLTPQQKRLTKVLSAQLLSIDMHYSDNQHTTKTFDTTAAEITHVASWVKQQYLAFDTQSTNANKTTQNQNSIAVIVPDLSTLKHTISTALDKQFGYDTQLTPSVQKAYNISLGNPMLWYELVDISLKLLSFVQAWHLGRVAQGLLSKVLLSPFIKGAYQEQSQRAQTDIKLQSLACVELKPAQILKVLQQQNCPLLTDIILGIDTTLNNFNSNQEKHHYGQWILEFTRILKHWSWGEDRRLSSTEYQLFNKYQQTQLSFQQLDILNKPVAFTKALSAWQQVLAQTSFSPKLAKPANIHILGQLEAQGLQFDKVWIMGMNSDFLPGKIKHYRFIESDIAMRFDLPDSHYARLNTQANLTLTHLKKLAPDQIFSYAKQDNSSHNRLRHATHLLEFSSTVLTDNLQYLAPKPLQVLTDNELPKLSDTHISQGIKTLEYQAQCAFRGGAQRFDIVDIPDLSIGINAMQKGQLMHKVLESLWGLLGNQTTLKQHQSQLALLVAQQIAQYLPNPTHFEQIEAKRIEGIIVALLEMELERKPFKVQSVEVVQTVNINGLSFNIRLDRIDIDEFGNKIIFDYKTGKVSAAQLGVTKSGLTGIITQPQLPIYALHNQADGVAFIGLRAQKVEYLGYAKTEVATEIFNQKSDSKHYTELQQFWQTSLNQTSLNFQQGKAEVDPTKGACEYCNLSSLCRISC